jgi:hypothetical protein
VRNVCEGPARSAMPARSSFAAAAAAPVGPAEVQGHGDSCVPERMLLPCRARAVAVLPVLGARAARLAGRRALPRCAQRWGPCFGGAQCCGGASLRAGGELAANKERVKNALYMCDVTEAVCCHSVVIGTCNT